MLLFVKAILDFGLPRWINAIGALSSGAFAVIILLQAISAWRREPWDLPPDTEHVEMPTA